VSRVFAILLMAVMSFQLITPALLAGDDNSNVPACCRRNGNHHCSIPAQSSHAGPAIEAVRCPFFPVGSALPGHASASAPGVSHIIFGGILSHPAYYPQVEALCRISYSRAGQKRGPPTFLF